MGRVELFCTVRFGEIFDEKLHFFARGRGGRGGGSYEGEEENEEEETERVCKKQVRTSIRLLC